MRGSIVDVYPSPTTTRCASTCGVTRSTGSPAFAVADQRSTHDVPRSRSSPRASCCRRRCASAPPSWCAPSRGARSRSSGSPRARRSTAWSRGCRGSPPTSSSCPTSCPTTRSCSLVRAPPHARPRAGAARRGGGARRRRSPSPGAPPTAAGRGVAAPLAAVRPAARAHAGGHDERARDAEGPDTPHLAGDRVRPGRGGHDGPRGSAARSSPATACASCWRPTARARPTVSRTCSHDEGVDTTDRRDRAGHDRHRRRAARPRRRGPAAPARDRRRGRPHRTSPGAPPSARRASWHRRLRRAQPRRLRRAPRPRRRALRRAWSSARSAAWRATTCCSSTRAATSSTCPPTRCGSVRRYTGGETPTLHRMGGADFEKSKAPCPRRGARDRAGARGALPPAPRHAPATRSRPTRRGSTRSRRRSRTRRRPTRRRRSSRSRPTWSSRVPMDRLVCGDVGFGKTEVAVRAAFKAVQDGKQVAVLVPTTLLASSTVRRSASASRATRSGSRCCRASSPTPSRTRSSQGLADGDVDVVIGTHRLLSDDIAFKDLGLLVIDEEQRFGVQHKEQIKELRDRRRRAHAVRDADPAHARAVAHRHPRPVARQHPARGPPADPHLRRRVRRPGRGRGASAASCCARARSSSSTTG